MALVGRVPHVDDVAPLSSADAAVLSELREVLIKHAAHRRFGITLLHEHFNMREDEILVETCDSVSRTLTIRPVNRSEVDTTSLLETSWMFFSESNQDQVAYEVVRSCRTFCDPKTGHNQSHHVV